MFVLYFDGTVRSKRSTCYIYYHHPATVTIDNYADNKFHNFGALEELSHTMFEDEFYTKVVDLTRSTTLGSKLFYLK
jgi:hypothetical protein